VARIRNHKKRLVRLARRCRTSNRGCTRKFARRVRRLTKRLRRHRRTCSTGRRNVCSRRLFRRWMRRMRARRARLQSLSSTCGDEDQQCVARTMRKVLRLNKRIAARRLRCHRKPETVASNSWVKTDTVHHVITKSVWRHALDCEAMRSGFARWLSNRRTERKRIHDSICRVCSPRDAECVKERYRRIMAIQHSIKSGRSEYVALVTKCDRCAPLRLRFERWVALQTRRRKRLHAEICKCSDTDTKCVLRRVLRIKRIQQRIKDGRKHIFHLNEHCQDDVLLTATVATTAAPVVRIGGAASTMLAGVATLFAVVMATLLL